MAERYPDGIDASWIGIDRDSRVALFITAGNGPIPDIVLTSDDASIFDLEDWIQELPIIAEVNLKIHVPDPSSFIEPAERGIYVFDWRNVVGPKPGQYTKTYEVVAIPSRPILFSELNDKLTDAVRDVRLNDVSFSQSETIDVCKWFNCLGPD